MLFTGFKNSIKLFLSIILCQFFGQMVSANSSLCRKIFVEPSTQTHPGFYFLHRKYPQLHNSEPVVITTAHYKKQTGKPLLEPADRLWAWLTYIDQNHIKLHDTDQNINPIKKYYYEKYLTKLTDVPNSFFDHYIRLAYERGEGNLILSDVRKKELAEAAISSQKESLDIWLNYLLSKDSEYPIWAKFWAFTSVVKLSKFDPERGTFNERSKGQMSPFPELNHEAFSMVIGALIQKVEGKSLKDFEDVEFVQLLDGAIFKKLYGRALHLAKTKVVTMTEDGEWKVFRQGSDPLPLVNSLAGMNTGWCTAAKWKAEEQLSLGDFYVYYSKDAEGIPKIPRIAIRMTGHTIAEVRGIGEQQNLDAKIAASNILTTKLKEFGDEGDRYKKKTEDMKLLTKIEEKHLKGLTLSSDELIFLYEIKSEINGFGQERDPRIKKILDARNKKQDLAVALSVKENEISLGQHEAFKKDIKVHYGDLYLRDIVSGGRLSTFPKIVIGSVLLNDLKTAKDVQFPEVITKGFNIESIRSPRGLVLPKEVRGDFYCGLTSAEGVIFPKNITHLGLPRLNTTRGLVLPEGLKQLSFSDLNSIDGQLTLVPSLTYFSANNIKSTRGLVLNNGLRWISLNGIKALNGLKVPESITDIHMQALENAEGLDLRPNRMRSISLSSLKSAKGLLMGESTFIDGIDLGGLEVHESLILPKVLEGRLSLNGLRNANGLIFPIRKGKKSVIYLLGLQSVENIFIPDSESKVFINKNVDLSQLSSADRRKFHFYGDPL